MKFCCALATHCQIDIVSLQDKNIVFIVDAILNRLRDKHTVFNILVTDQVPVENYKAVFSSHRSNPFTEVNYKFQERNLRTNYMHFLSLASALEFSKTITLDFSGVKEDKQISAQLKSEFPKKTFKLQKCTCLVFQGLASLSMCADLVKAFTTVTTLKVQDTQTLTFEPFDVSCLPNLQDIEIEEQESSTVLSRLIPETFVIKTGSNDVKLEMNFLYTKFDLVNLLNFVALNPQI